MRVVLTQNQILEYARRSGLLGVRRADCSVEYVDGVDAENAIADGIRRRYVELLDTGERRHIAPADISAQAGCRFGDKDVTRVALPAGVRRVFDIRLTGWDIAVPVLEAADMRAVVCRQQNPFTAADSTAPVAVAEPAVNGEIRAVLCWPPGAVAELLVAAVDDGPDVYALDDSAIELLFSDFKI